MMMKPILIVCVFVFVVLDGWMFVDAQRVPATNVNGKPSLVNKDGDVLNARMRNLKSRDKLKKEVSSEGNQISCVNLFQNISPELALLVSKYLYIYIISHRFANHLFKQVYKFGTRKGRF